MTSLQIIEEQTYKFLENETPEVVVIKGAWGVGKTFAWKKYLSKAQKHKKIALNKYSYVSLFGINSLDALKFAIFEKSVDIKSIGEEPNLETFNNSISLFKKSIPFLKDGAAFFRLNDLVGRALSFLSVNKTIICLDDFERMRLDAQDVLGLISELKEQKKCKMILIMNDEGLSQEAKTKYDIYREKVVDKEFDFYPTPEECAQIVFGNDEFQKNLKERCCNLGIKNIRIIKKIKKFWEEVSPFLESYEEETKHSVMTSVVLFTYALYAKNEKVPDYEFIKKMNSYDFIVEKRDEDNPEKKKQDHWKNILRSYGYIETNELDLQIAAAIERGYFIYSQIKQELEKYNNGIKINKSDNSRIRAWEKYHNNFDDNATDLVSSIYEATKNHIANIAQAHLSSSLWLLRELGANDKADELIELAVSKRVDADFFDLNKYMFRDRVSDQKMIDRFAKVFSERRPTKTPLEVLKDISSNNGWSPEDEIVLAALSADDFYNLFKAEKSEQLTAYIRRCLDFGRYTDSSERQKLIANNATEALKRIAGESKLNQLRVKKYGIDA